MDIETADDEIDEESEQLTLTLTNPVNATLGTDASTATGTIHDNDTEPLLEVEDAELTEGDTGTDLTMRFTVTLSKRTERVMTVVPVTKDDDDDGRL